MVVLQLQQKRKQICLYLWWWAVTAHHLRVPSGIPSPFHLHRRDEYGKSDFHLSWLQVPFDCFSYILNLKHLVLRHSGKGYIISACEVQEAEGRSKRLRIMHSELRGCRCVGNFLEFMGAFQWGKKVSWICRFFHDITNPSVRPGFDHQALWKHQQTTWPTFSLAFEQPGWFSCAFWKKYWA